MWSWLMPWFARLAPARCGTDDRVHFARCFVVPETGAEDMICRHNAFQRRLNDLLGRRGDHVEIELLPFAKVV